jgi:exosortase
VSSQAQAEPVSSQSRAEPVRSGVLRNATLLLAILGVELVLLYAPTVKWLIDRWTMSVWHNAHGFLIPPVVAYFAWNELKPLRGLPASSSAWGFLFLAPALLLLMLDAGMHTEILSAMSIVIALPGLALLFLGTARTKAIGFPLAFSTFMLPIPLAVTERLHLVLREIATYGAGQLVPLVGIPVFAEETTLHIGNGVLFVGDGCSGFSTLYAAVAVAALTAYSCNHWRGRILALAGAVPIAVASNVFRVCLLAVLARWRGFDILETWMHPASGILTFVISLPIIFWLGAPRPEKATA